MKIVQDNPVLTAAVGQVVAAVALRFGLQLDAAQTLTVASVLAAGLGLVVRALVTPMAKQRRQTTTTTGGTA